MALLISYQQDFNEDEQVFLLLFLQKMKHFRNKENTK